MDIHDGDFYPCRYPEEGEQYGSYRIEAVVDEDPSGRIYRALDQAFSRPVRLKVLADSIAHRGGFIDILRIQMQAAAGLKHSGLSQIYELSSLGNQSFIASEWGKGAWLSRLLVHRGKFPLEEAINAISKCAETLSAISQSRIFHGNLKPGNIMLMTSGEIQISDTGFANAARTVFGPFSLAACLGTSSFLAPEMTEPGLADFRADIYSLGIIFYYLLFQAIPFRDEGQKLSVQSDEPDAPIYPDVLEVISRMTERNSDQRYENYEKLIEHLKHLRLIHMQAVKIPAVSNLWGAAGIKTQSLFKLLCAVFVSGISGVLTVTQGDAQRKFYLRNRQFVFFESKQIEDSIWSWLVKKKELDIRNKPDDKDYFQISLNRVIAKGFIRLEDFKFRYEELMNRVLADVLKWTSVDVEFLNADIQNEPLASIPLSELLLRAARHSVELRDVKKELRTDTLLRRTALFQTLIPEFQLNQEERSLAALTQDALHVGGLMTSGAEEKPLRFLYLLAQIGTLEVGSISKSGTFNATEFEREPLPEIEAQHDADDHLHDQEWEPPVMEALDGVLNPVRPEVQRTESMLSIERLDAEAENRFAQAKEHYENGNFWQAARYCEMALAIHEDARYYSLMGHAYAQHPKFRNKAEDCFHHAIHLDPLNAQIHVELGKFYMDVGLGLRARTHFRKALEIVSNLPEAVEFMNLIDAMNLGVGGCRCEHKPGCDHH